MRPIGATGDRNQIRLAIADLWGSRGQTTTARGAGHGIRTAIWGGRGSIITVRSCAPVRDLWRAVRSRSLFTSFYSRRSDCIAGVCVCVWWYCVDLVVFVVRVVYWFVCVYNWFDDGLNVEFSSRFKCGCYSWTRHMMIFRTDWIIGAMTYVWFQWIRKWDVIFIIWVIRKYIEWKFTIWLLKLLYNVTHLKTEKARVRIVWKTK